MDEQMPVTEAEWKTWYESLNPLERGIVDGMNAAFESLKQDIVDRK